MMQQIPEIFFSEHEKRKISKNGMPQNVTSFKISARLARTFWHHTIFHQGPLEFVRLRSFYSEYANNMNKKFKFDKIEPIYSC